LTPAAFEWVEEHIPEGAQRLGNAIAVEHRYIGTIAEGIYRGRISRGVKGFGQFMMVWQQSLDTDDKIGR